MDKLCYFINDRISEIKNKYQKFANYLKKFKSSILLFTLSIILIIINFTFEAPEYIAKENEYKSFQTISLDFLATMISEAVNIFFFTIHYIVIVQAWMSILFIILLGFFLYCSKKSKDKYHDYWIKKGKEKKIQEFADNFRKSWWTVIFLGGLLTLLGITNFAKNRNSQKTSNSMKCDINQTTLDVHKIELSLKKLILQSDSLSDKVDSLKKKSRTSNQLEQTVQTLVKDMEEIKQNKQESLLVKENNVSR